MVVHRTAIDGVLWIQPDVHRDDRGRFAEIFRQSWFDGAGELPAVDFVQMNQTDRVKNTLVGFHYHLRQYDYWRFTSGKALIALHDLRAASPTRSKTIQMWVDGEDGDNRSILIPPGVAHGFHCRSKVVTLVYAHSRYHDPSDELGVAWDDPDVGANWYLSDLPLLSRRDQTNGPRKEVHL